MKKVNTFDKQLLIILRSFEMGHITEVDAVEEIYCLLVEHLNIQDVFDIDIEAPVFDVPKSSQNL